LSHALTLLAGEGSILCDPEVTVAPTRPHALRSQAAASVLEERPARVAARRESAPRGGTAIALARVSPIQELRSTGGAVLRLIATKDGFLVLPRSDRAFTRSCASDLVAFLRTHDLPFLFGSRDEGVIIKVGPLTELQSAEFARWADERANAENRTAA
jgi:hypothetical protein